jgi:hypothetical protein
MRFSALLLLALPAFAGTLVLEDSFNGPSMDPLWRAAKGEWKQEGGWLRGAEVAADKHAAVVRRPVAFLDGEVRLRFQFDGARQVALSINGAKGHICRVVATPKGFRIVKDGNPKTGDKAVTLASSTAPLAAGEWHELTMTMEGAKLSAKIGATLLTGEHPAIAESKADIGLPVGGVSAAFDWIQVYKSR